MATSAPSARSAATAGDGPVPASLPTAIATAVLAATVAAVATVASRGAAVTVLARAAKALVQVGATVAVGATQVPATSATTGQTSGRGHGDVATGLAFVGRTRLLLVGIATACAAKTAPAGPQVLAGLAEAEEGTP